MAFGDLFGEFTRLAGHCINRMQRRVNSSFIHIRVIRGILNRAQKQLLFLGAQQLEAVWEPSTSHWMGSIPMERMAEITWLSYSP